MQINKSSASLPSENAADSSGHYSAGRDLGASIRFEREKAAKTLREIAQSCGLTSGFISQIERGISKPSLTSLYAIAKALNVPVDRFVSAPLERRGKSVSHRHDRQIIRIDNSERHYELLEPGFSGAMLNACMTHVPPGYESDLMSHEGEDFIYLIRGSVIYEIDGVDYPLEQGGTLHFPSSQTHRLRNTGFETATELWVGTMRVFPE